MEIRPWPSSFVRMAFQSSSSRSVSASVRPAIGGLARSVLDRQVLQVVFAHRGVVKLPEMLLAQPIRQFVPIEWDCGQAAVNLGEPIRRENAKDVLVAFQLVLKEQAPGLVQRDSHARRVRRDRQKTRRGGTDVAQWRRSKSV
jgi:hypothetical protein